MPAWPRGAARRAHDKVGLPDDTPKPAHPWGALAMARPNRQSSSETERGEAAVCRGIVYRESKPERRSCSGAGLLLARRVLAVNEGMARMKKNRPADQAGGAEDEAA